MRSIAGTAARLALLAAALTSAGCYTCYTGTARDASLPQLAADPSWQIVPGVPFVGQKSDRDCGAAALAMVLSRWYGRETVDVVAALAPPGGAGIRVGTLRDLARRRGLHAFVISGTLADLARQLALGRPVVVGLYKPMAGGRVAAHYEVIVGLNRAKGLILSLDPARGPRQNTFEGFAREWIPTRRVTLIAFPSIKEVDNQTKLLQLERSRGPLLRNDSGSMPWRRSDRQMTAHWRPR